MPRSTTGSWLIATKTSKLWPGTHLDINCKRAHQHEQLIVCNIDRRPTEAFKEVHWGHGWGLDGPSSDHHIQKRSNTTLQTETKISLRRNTLASGWNKLNVTAVHKPCQIWPNCFSALGPHHRWSSPTAAKVAPPVQQKKKKKHSAISPLTVERLRHVRRVDGRLVVPPTCIRLKRATSLMGASEMMPYCSGLTMAGQMKQVSSRSVHMVRTSPTSRRSTHDKVLYICDTIQRRLCGKQ